MATPAAVTVAAGNVVTKRNWDLTKYFPAESPGVAYTSQAVAAGTAPLVHAAVTIPVAFVIETPRGVNTVVGAGGDAIIVAPIEKRFAFKEL